MFLKAWKTGSKFANLIATKVQIIGCELHDTSEPLVEFESSDNRGLNNQ